MKTTIPILRATRLFAIASAVCLAGCVTAPAPKGGAANPPARTSRAIPRLHALHCGDSLILAGTAMMDAPTGSPHVRQVEFRCARLAPNPVVTATVFSPESAGEIFAVYKVNVNDLGGETQIAVIAQRVPSAWSSLPYRCNVIVVGKPIK